MVELVDMNSLGLLDQVRSYPLTRTYLNEKSV